MGVLFYKGRTTGYLNDKIKVPISIIVWANAQTPRYMCCYESYEGPISYIFLYRSYIFLYPLGIEVYG